MNRIDPTHRLLMRYYERLRERFGPRNWWPGETPFEVCVGAILTQNTAWKNVAKAIANLKAAESLDPFVLHGMDIAVLAELIRPSGYYNIKAGRLRNFTSHLVEKHGGSLESLFASAVPDLRDELLSINGIGKETADSMILYAAKKPIFVVDAYTKRVLHRHGFIEERADYDAMQEFFHTRLPPETSLFNDFHAQIVAVGHHYCKKRPLCDGCPLAAFLDGGRHGAIPSSP